jgi:hypothetical protein
MARDFKAEGAGLMLIASSASLSLREQNACASGDEPRAKVLGKNNATTLK